MARKDFLLSYILQPVLSHYYSSEGVESILLPWPEFYLTQVNIILPKCIVWIPLPPLKFVALVTAGHPAAVAAAAARFDARPPAPVACPVPAVAAHTGAAGAARWGPPLSRPSVRTVLLLSPPPLCVDREPMLPLVPVGRFALHVESDPATSAKPRGATANPSSPGTPSTGTKASVWYIFFLVQLLNLAFAPKWKTSCFSTRGTTLPSFFIWVLQRENVLSVGFESKFKARVKS